MIKSILKNNTTVIIVLFSLNAILKFFYIDLQQIGLDEPFSIFHAQLNVSTIIKELTAGNNPPLFEIILHYWISVFGIGTFSVRFLPYLFSIFTLPFIYKIGNKHYNKQTAILGSLLFIFSSLNTFYAYEVRVYSLFVLLSVISQYLFLTIQNNNSKTIYKVLFVLINILLIYAHYFGIFILFTQAIAILSIKKYRKNLKLFAVLYLIIFLSFLPLLQVLITQLHTSASSGTWIETPTGFKSLYFMFIHFCNSPLSVYIIILTLLASVFIKKINFKPVSLSLLILWFVIPFFGMFAISFLIPMYIPRYLVFASPALYIIIAYKTSTFFSQKLYFNYIIGAVIGLLFVFSTELNPAKNSHEKEMANILLQKRTENSIVLLSPDYYTINFTYHYNKDIFSSVNNYDIYAQQYSLLEKENINVINSKVDIDFKSLQNFDTIIFYDAGSSFLNPDNQIFDVLNQKYKLQESFDFNKSFKLHIFTQDISK